MFIKNVSNLIVLKILLRIVFIIVWSYLNLLSLAFSWLSCTIIFFSLHNRSDCVDRVNSLCLIFNIALNIRASISRVINFIKYIYSLDKHKLSLYSERNIFVSLKYLPVLFIFILYLVSSRDWSKILTTN